jgi:hypothetical protein
MPVDESKESKYATSELKTKLDAAQAKIVELKQKVESQTGGKKSKTYARLEQFEKLIDAQQKVMPLYDDGKKPSQDDQFKAIGINGWRDKISIGLPLKSFADELQGTKVGQNLRLSDTMARAKGKEGFLREGETKASVQPRQVFSEFVETIDAQHVVNLIAELCPGEKFLTKADIAPEAKVASLPVSPMMGSQLSSALNTSASSLSPAMLSPQASSLGSSSPMLTPSAMSPFSNPLSSPREAHAPATPPPTIAELRELKGKLAHDHDRLTRSLTTNTSNLSQLHISRNKLEANSQALATHAGLSVPPAQKQGLANKLNEASQATGSPHAIVKSLYQSEALSGIDGRSAKVAALGQMLGWPEESEQLKFLKKAQQAETHPLADNLSPDESRVLREALKKSGEQLAVSARLDETDKAIEKAEKAQSNLNSSLAEINVVTQKIDAQIEQLDTASEKLRDMKLSLVEYQIHLSSELSKSPIGTDQYNLLKDKKEIVENILSNIPHEGKDEVKLQMLKGALKANEPILCQDQKPAEKGLWEKISDKLSDHSKPPTMGASKETTPREGMLARFNQLSDARNKPPAAGTEPAPNREVGLRR